MTEISSRCTNAGSVRAKCPTQSGERWRGCNATESRDFFNVWSSVEWPLNTPAKANLPKEEALPYRMQLLFKDGLFLSFDGENFKNFVPFDKSSSMARSCQITFIDSQIKEDLDKRLMLDMNMHFISKELVLSKFYAYRGLYLSAASRVDTVQKFPLNEETVIVLKDYEKTLDKFGN